MSTINGEPVRLISYPGSKWRAINFLMRFVPDYDEYREPFAGSAALFFELKRRYPCNLYWINDVYWDLANFWIQVRDRPGELIENITSILDLPYRLKLDSDFNRLKSVFYKIRNENKAKLDSHDTKDFDRAVAFFIVNISSFSGTSRSGGYSTNKFCNIYTPEKYIQSIEFYSRLLQDTKITCLDYKEVLLESGCNVFSFLDPPYWIEFAMYGKCGSTHKNFNHFRLAEVLKQTNHNWLMTYNCSDQIRELYAGYNQLKWNLIYTMQRHKLNKSGSELLIANYSLDNYLLL